MKDLESFKVTVISAESDLNSKELVNALNEFEKGSVQVFDEESIAGEKHVKFAFLHALSAFEDQKNISRDKGLEILLRAATSRQITEATERVGVKDPKRIIIGFVEKFEKEQEILKVLKARKKESNFGKEKVIEKFGLDKNKPLEKQIISKMILLQVE